MNDVVVKVTLNDETDHLVTCTGFWDLVVPFPPNTVKHIEIVGEL